LFSMLPHPRYLPSFPTRRSSDLSAESAYIGSGQLDGNGIPPTFFSDINARKAMNYCFNYDVYISEALNNEGLRNNGPIISGMLGDRKSTRLNSSHVKISYAVFCL